MFTENKKSLSQLKLFRSKFSKLIPSLCFISYPYRIQKKYFVNMQIIICIFTLKYTLQANMII